MMKTLDRTETPESVDPTPAPGTLLKDQVLTLRRRNRFLVWLALALTAVVAALAAWAIFAGDDDAEVEPSAPAITAEQEEMLDTLESYMQAWNDGDGEAVAELMLPSGFHDNGQRFYVRNGELADFVDMVAASGFSVRSDLTPDDVAFVDNFVLTKDYIPEWSETAQPSFFKMTEDGTQVVWHYAP